MKAHKNVLSNSQFFDLSISERRKYFIALNRLYADLEKKLFRLGGNMLIYTPQPGNPSKLLKRGKATVDPKIIWLSPKQFPSACHTLAFAAYQHLKWPFYSGYALSDDGKWRQHSWSVDKGCVKELTGIPRTAYFGYELNEKEMMELV